MVAKKKINKKKLLVEQENVVEKTTPSIFDNFLKYITLALFVLALVLGYKVYKVYYPSEKINLSFLDTTQTNSPTPTVSESIVINTNNNISYDSLESLLVFPSQDATSETKQAHYDAVVNKAVEDKEITISQCKPENLVTKIKNGNSVNIKNEGPDDIKIRLDDKQIFDVTKNSTKEVKFNFQYGQGVYGYMCNDLGGPVGILLVVE